MNAIIAAILVQASAIPQPVPSPPAPPPAVTGGGLADAALLAWMPGEVTCEGKPVRGAPIRRSWTTISYGNAMTLSPATYAFEIDADGRPVSIARVDKGFAPHITDVAPALAASQFARGAPQKGCRIVYAPERTPLSEAPVADLISYTITPRSGALPQTGWDRIKRPGDCLNDPRPQPLVQVFPDFTKVKSTPGVKDWAMVDYDTDAEGRPRNVSVSNGTGNAELDAASVAAIGASRFTQGARTGCRYPFWRGPAPLSAPAMPEEAAFRPDGATCEGPRQWKTPPRLTFPENFRQRSIEGWAIVTYDIAPWGEVGNVKAVLAQPSEDFGRQAVQVMRAARVEPSASGVSGCVDRVRFVMGPTGDAPQR